MPKLYSYVVHHDHGFAPNPSGGFCTLAKCKYGKKRRNIVELARQGDWIAGTGGANPQKSAGHGRLIYAMRVDEIIPLSLYCQKHSGKRIDAEMEGDAVGRLALLSRHFFYFGRDAIAISDIPKHHLNHSLEKAGPGHRTDFSEEFVEAFAKWLNDNFAVGVHGLPCEPHPGFKLPKCQSTAQKKGCKA